MRNLVAGIAVVIGILSATSVCAIAGTEKIPETCGLDNP